MLNFKKFTLYDFPCPLTHMDHLLMDMKYFNEQWEMWKKRREISSDINVPYLPTFAISSSRSVTSDV